MASDPLSVLNAWTNDVWHAGRLDRIPDLVSDPCRRHDPGTAHDMSVAENTERVIHGREQFPGVRFENHLTVTEGEYITSCYTMRWMGPDPTETHELSGMEVFRVVNGKITETWNLPPSQGAWR
jgi:predicted SnoaL-like aldol condensation-catalyzing enzyme